MKTFNSLPQAQRAQSEQGGRIEPDHGVRWNPINRCWMVLERYLLLSVLSAILIASPIHLLATEKEQLQFSVPAEEIEVVIKIESPEAVGVRGEIIIYDPEDPSKIIARYVILGVTVCESEDE